MNLDLLDKNEDLLMYWEWPKDNESWKTPEVRWFIRELEKRNVSVFDVIIDGCMVGVVNREGLPMKKPWRIMTNDKEFVERMQNVRCDGSHIHFPVSGKDAYQSGFYPVKFVKRIVHVWKESDRKTMRSQLEDGDEQKVYVTLRLPKSSEPKPTDPAKLDAIRRVIHKIHVRGGHVSRTALADLFRRRGCPEWVSEMALELHCDACLEHTQRPGPLPASLLRPPRLWQCLGMDAFELTKGAVKQYLVVYIDIACRLAAIGKLSEEVPLRQVRVPSTDLMVESFSSVWLQHKPRPQWLMTDPATCFSSDGFSSWTATQGFGLFITAGEAHFMLGAVEGLLKPLKETAVRLMTSSPNLSIFTAACLACAAHNQQERVGGYSPAQWAYGAYSQDDPNVSGSDPTGPGGLARAEMHRVEAERIYIDKRARQVMTKLNHTISRALTTQRWAIW